MCVFILFYLDVTENEGMSLTILQHRTAARMNSKKKMIYIAPKSKSNSLTAPVISFDTREVPSSDELLLFLVPSNFNLPLKKCNCTSAISCMARDEMGLSGNLSRRSLVYNYDKSTGPLLLWQMIEGDLINLQIDIKHQESALACHLI